MAAALEAALLLPAAGREPSPRQRDLARALVAVQMQSVPALLAASAGVRDMRRPELSRAVGLVDESWLARPRGSVAHALQATAVALRGRMLAPHGCVFMASGGAPLSWEVQARSTMGGEAGGRRPDPSPRYRRTQAFFSALVFVGRFYDAFGATEAPGIGYGTTGWLDAGIPSRLAAEGRDPARPATVGLLECRAPGAATRYFGADEGDADAAQYSRDAFTADGYWRSGDMVELANAESGGGGCVGRLRVLGRAADRLELYVGGDSVWASAGDLAAAFGACRALHEGQVREGWWWCRREGAWSGGVGRERLRFAVLGESAL